MRKCRQKQTTQRQGLHVRAVSILQLCSRLSCHLTCCQILGGQEQRAVVLWSPDAQMKCGLWASSVSITPLQTIHQVLQRIHMHTGLVHGSASHLCRPQSRKATCNQPWGCKLLGSPFHSWDTWSPGNSCQLPTTTEVGVFCQQTQSIQLLLQLLQGLCAASLYFPRENEFPDWDWFLWPGGEKTNLTYPLWLLLSKPKEKGRRNVTALPKGELSWHRIKAPTPELEGNLFLNGSQIWF